LSIHAGLCISAALPFELELSLRHILPILALAILGGCDKPTAENQPVDVTAQATPAKGVDRSKAGTPAPDEMIVGADEAPAALASLKGKPVLVNYWAIWCAPCVKELPTLEALSKEAGAPQVVAVSEDSATRATVDAFLEDHKLSGLTVWRDPDMAASSNGVQILPTTILYGSDGKEIWRYSGDLDWTGAEAKRLLAEAR
jgi:thiol-disulfide isomerase/thioredoxin